MQSLNQRQLIVQATEQLRIKNDIDRFSEVVLLGEAWDSPPTLANVKCLQHLIKSVFSLQVIVVVAFFNIWKIKYAKKIASFIAAGFKCFESMTPGRWVSPPWHVYMAKRDRYSRVSNKKQYTRAREWMERNDHVQNARLRNERDSA